MAPESIMPPGPAEQPAKPQCSTQPNIFTPTTAPHGAQGLRLRRRSVAGLANLKNNSSAAEPLRIAGFAGSICGRMSTPGHAVTGPQSPPNHILKAMARYRVSQSEEGVSAPLGAIMPEESGRECEVRRSIRRSRDDEEDEEAASLYQGRPSQEAKVRRRSRPRIPTCVPDIRPGLQRRSMEIERVAVDLARTNLEDIGAFVCANPTNLRTNSGTDPRISEPVEPLRV